jgi:hypothetical protein
MNLGPEEYKRYRDQLIGGRVACSACRPSLR